jgi:sugar (pentulose or hexulose) kinase
MSETRTIGIDLGTSAIKGALISEGGAILATHTRATELDRPGPREVVFSTDRCYAILCEVLQALTQADPAGRIGAVALSGATGDTVLLSQAGRPLLPAIHWMDSRSSEDPAIDPPGMTPADIYQVSGWPWFRSFPLAQLAWLKTHQAEAYHQAHRVGMNLTYQYYRLCGAWAIDPSTATTFYLQDQQQLKWHPPYLDWLGLKAGQLPQLQPSGCCIGRISVQSASETGLPEGCAVVLGAFDHPSAARGAGVTKPGELLLSLGTSWVGFYPVRERALALKQNMLVDPFLSGEQGPWAGLFSLAKAGERFNDALRRSYPEAASEGTRYGLLERDLRQVISGGGAGNAATVLIRELVLSMREKMDDFSRQGIPASRIVLVGGPSANPAIVALFRQIMDRPVEVAPSSGHSGAVGAARLALKGIRQRPAGRRFLGCRL